MRILVMAPQPFFTPRGTPLSVYYRTLCTSRQGASIDLLTYGDGADVDLPGVRIIRIPHLRWFGPVRTGPSVLKLVLDLVMACWAVGLLIRNRYDVVHAHEEAVFWSRFLKPIFGFKLVYDMHSSLPQQLTNFDYTRSRLLIRLFRSLEASALRNADVVITICPDLREYALRFDVAADRHLLIENSLFDDVRVKHSNGAPRLPADHVSEHDGKLPRPLVLYAGTFEHYQGLDLLLQAFAEVSRRHERAHLLLVGGTPEQAAAMRMAARAAGLEGRCTVRGRVTRKRALELLGEADILVSPRREGMNTPLKIYEQLASGKPLVATRVQAHTQVLTDDVSFLVDPEPASMARGILDAIEDTERRERVVAGALALYEERYSPAVYEAKIKRLLEIVA